jgi:hypothetical protein
MRSLIIHDPRSSEALSSLLWKLDPVPPSHLELSFSSCEFRALISFRQSLAKELLPDRSTCASKELSRTWKVRGKITYGEIIIGCRRVKVGVCVHFVCVHFVCVHFVCVHFV